MIKVYFSLIKVRQSRTSMESVITRDLDSLHLDALPSLSCSFLWWHKMTLWL